MIFCVLIVVSQVENNKIVHKMKLIYLSSQVIEMNIRLPLKRINILTQHSFPQSDNKNSLRLCKRLFESLYFRAHKLKLVVFVDINENKDFL